MRALRLESGGNIFIDGEQADISQLENKGEFLSSILTLDVELSEDVTLGEVVHLFYDLKGLIKNILSEEYELVRTLVTATALPRNFKYVRVYKSFKIENESIEGKEEFIYLMPEIEVVPSEPGEDGIRNLAGLPIKIDENIKLVHGDTNTTIESKAKVSLFDLMTCLFEDLAELLKEGALLS